jgi:hypothetical protein
MKRVYLTIILGAMLLTSAMSTSYASTGPDVKVMAKEKQGLIMLLVKNGQSINIHGVKLTLLDGDITSVKTSEGWGVNISPSDSKTITLITDKAPIKANDRAVFFIGTDNINTIISWSATDRFGSTIDTDNTRMVVRQKLNNAVPTDTEPTYISNAKSLAITTDKIFYNKSDKMFISGALDPNTEVIITIYTPNGQKIKIMDETDPTGSFKALHVLQNADSGTYRVKVRQADGYAETTFKVL